VRKTGGGGMSGIYTIFKIHTLFFSVSSFSVAINLGNQARTAIADNFEILLNTACLRAAFHIVSFENHISLVRQMLTGDTSRPLPLRYLRTCVKVDNTDATTGLLAPKIRAVHAATRDLLLSRPPFSLSLLLRSFAISSSSRDTKRDDEVTSVLSSPRILLEAESGCYLRSRGCRDIREVSAVSTGERARVLRLRGHSFPDIRWPNCKRCSTNPT